MQAIDALSLAMTFKGALAPGPLDQALALWRDAGGTLDIDKAHVETGGTTLDLTGTLALDGAMQPEGALTATITGADKAVDAVVAAGGMEARYAGIAKSVLRAISAPTGTGADALRVPLTLEDRRLFIGPAAVAHAAARRLALSSVRRGGHLLRRLGALEHAVLAVDCADGDAVIGEDRAAAFKLRRVMARLLAPALDRLGITPKRDRDQLARLGEALEPFDRDEAVDRLDVGSERRGKIEIVLLPAGPRLDFEDHGMHRTPPSSRLQA